MTYREVIRTVTGHPAIDGAGVHLTRVIGYHDVKDFDPFLMLDAFDSHNPEDYVKGFPWHPHRGIETVTYLISGEIDHADSLGNGGVISAGECQWMTAGCGILHQEMPQEADHMLGFQLWINLPRRDKMTEPKYFDIRADMVQNVVEDGSTVRIVSGEYGGKRGVKSHHEDVTLLDVALDAGKDFVTKTDEKANLFVYIIEGSGYFGANQSTLYTAKNALLFDRRENFLVKAGMEGIRFALFAGRPLEEPIAWGGPIVMNTREELDEAFRELEAGTFIRK